jgi:HPt (histidine-containing phosphotransfer) domain-containing protein
VPVKETHLADAVYEQLRHAMAADPAGFTALYRDYLADAHQSLRLLRESVQARNIEKVRAKAHYLRSGSLVLGAPAVAHGAAMLEEAAIAGDAGSFDVLLKKIEMAVNAIQAELSERLGESVLPAEETKA